LELRFSLKKESLESIESLYHDEDKEGFVMGENMKRALLTCVGVIICGQGAWAGDVEEAAKVEVEVEVVNDINENSYFDQTTLEVDAPKVIDTKEKEAEADAFEDLGTPGEVIVIEKKRGDDSSSGSSGTTDSADQD